MIDVTKSLKLQTYLDNQKLSLEDIDFLNKVNLSDLILKSEYDEIKSEVERYNTLKKALETGSNNAIQISDEMKNLNQQIVARTGKDASQVSLHSIPTADKLEQILQSSGITSKNDLTVRIVYNDDEGYNSDYVRVELTDSKWDRYGINPGTRMAITDKGEIITLRSQLYMK